LPVAEIGGEKGQGRRKKEEGLIQQQMDLRGDVKNSEHSEETATFDGLT